MPQKRSAENYQVHPNLLILYLPVTSLLHYFLIVGTDMYEDSWFQLEGAAWRPFRHPIDAVRHGFNFMQYKLRQSQVSLDRR